MSHKKTIDILLQKIMITFIVIWTISPFMEIDGKWRILALMSACIWFIIQFTKTRFIVTKSMAKAIFFALAVAFIGFLQYERLAGIMKSIPIYILVICYLISCYYRDRWEELTGIVFVVLILLIIFNIRSIQAVTLDPTLARRLVRDDESIYVYLRQGIGGYSLLYPQVIIFPALLAWIQKSFRYKKSYFVVGIVWLVSYVIFILKSGYSIAIVTTIIGLIILYFYKGNNIIRAFIITFFVFLIGLGCILYLDGFRNMLLSVFDGTAVAKKINDLMLSAQSGEAVGSISARMMAYQYSAETILKYPIIGGMWMESGGGHSAFLDAFAKYGLWGGPIYISMLFSIPNYYRKKSSNKRIIVIANATFVTMLFVSILDSYTYAFMGMALVVLPLLFEDISKWVE